MAETENEAGDPDRRWHVPPKPTSPEVTAAYMEISSKGESAAEPSGTVAAARRRGEVIPEEEEDRSGPIDPTQ
jgi:hypothetical protein